MRYTLLFCCVFLIILLVGCDSKNKKTNYPEFTETTSGLLYHRHNIGEGKSYPENNDFLILNLTFKTIQNEVIPITILKNEEGWDTLHFKNWKTNFLLYEALSFLSQGDSCTFILNTKMLFDTTEFTGISAAFKNDTVIVLEAKLLSLKTVNQQKKEREASKKLNAELAADEQILLTHFLDTSTQNFPKTPDSQGIYFRLLRKGNGNSVKTGDQVTLRYIGKFLDGSVFDSATYQNEPLNFRLGEPGQLVRGLELAVYKMHEGDIANILVPSPLAFGSKGSAGGIVSPFKTVTFALEILKIN